jgi:PKD repeat protein
VAPLPVTFTDQSTGTITTRQWDFGDSVTSSDQSPTHTYDGAGSYKASLTVTGPGGTNTKSQQIVVSAPAVASFAASPTTGVAPLAVTFTDTSTGAIDTWKWSFGDTTTSNAQSPAHTYDAPGTYTASLTVSGLGGTDTKSQQIVVNAPAVASFTANPTAGVAPLGVTFTDTSTGAIDTWQWSFGDNATSNAHSPQHTYDMAGTYTASLTVSGPGGTDSVSHQIVVNEPPPPVPVASFTRSPLLGAAPLTVTFSDTSTGTITSWAWSFSDGGSASGPSASHTFLSSGVYTATLQVTGPWGSSSASQQITASPPVILPPVNPGCGTQRCQPPAEKPPGGGLPGGGVLLG